MSRKRAVEPEAWVRGGQGEVRQVTLSGLRLRDLECSVPWRVFRSRQGQVHLSGSYWSATMAADVVYESRLELARLLLADFDPSVATIYGQPFRLVAVVGGRIRRHVPDFVLGHGDGTVRVVNVKPAERLDDPKVAEALAWPAELFAAHGWSHEV